MDRLLIVVLWEGFQEEAPTSRSRVWVNWWGVFLSHGCVARVVCREYFGLMLVSIGIHRSSERVLTARMNVMLFSPTGVGRGMQPVGVLVARYWQWRRVALIKYPICRVIVILGHRLRL